MMYKIGRNLIYALKKSYAFTPPKSIKLTTTERRYEEISLTDGRTDVFSTHGVLFLLRQERPIKIQSHTNVILP
jgi:hypothetical protein